MDNRQQEHMVLTKISANSPKLEHQPLKDGNANVTSSESSQRKQAPKDQKQWPFLEKPHPSFSASLSQVSNLP
jgi:hypothetical protein